MNQGLKNFTTYTSSSVLCRPPPPSEIRFSRVRQYYKHTTVPQYHSTTVPQYHSTTVLQYYSTTVPQYHSTTVLQYHSTIPYVWRILLIVLGYVDVNDDNLTRMNRMTKKRQQRMVHGKSTPEKLTSNVKRKNYKSQKNKQGSVVWKKK